MEWYVWLLKSRVITVCLIFFATVCSVTSCQNGGVCCPRDLECKCADGFTGETCQKCKFKNWYKSNIIEIQPALTFLGTISIINQFVFSTSSVIIESINGYVDTLHSTPDHHHPCLPHAMQCIFMLHLSIAFIGSSMHAYTFLSIISLYSDSIDYHIIYKQHQLQLVVSSCTPLSYPYCASFTIFINFY